MAERLCEGDGDEKDSICPNYRVMILKEELGDFAEWELVGESNKHNIPDMRWRLVMGKDTPLPPRKCICLCKYTPIERNCYVRHKVTREIRIIGRMCKNHFLPAGEARLACCAECGSPHRNRYANYCNPCGKCPHGRWKIGEDRQSCSKCAKAAASAEATVPIIKWKKTYTYAGRPKYVYGEYSFGWTKDDRVWIYEPAQGFLSGCVGEHAKDTDSIKSYVEGLARASLVHAAFPPVA